MRQLVALILTLLCAAASAQDDGLMQGVKGDRPSYPLGEEVTITYSLKNVCDQPLVYNFSSAKQYDISIKRGTNEVFRLSRGKMYAQMMTNLVLQPGETKSFEVRWDQRDPSGAQVGPGVYTITAWLTPSGRTKPPVTTGKLEIGTKAGALIPVTIKEAITRSTELVNRRVSISGVYKGWEPDPNDPNCKGGPPVTRSDWVLSDATGCIYVTGPINLDPKENVGTKIAVIGRVQKTPKGQVYLVLESVTCQ